MLSSIHPLGERARRQRWGLTVTAYGLASLVGGICVGAAAGALGVAAGEVGLTPAAAIWPAAATALVAAAVDAGRARPPGPRRQVDEDWLTRYRGWVYGAGFGFQLGLGAATMVTTATLYAALAVAAFSGSPAGGALVGAVFGGVRAAPVIAGRRLRDPEAVRRTHRRLVERGDRARAAGAAGALAVGAWLVAAGVAGA